MYYEIPAKTCKTLTRTYVDSRYLRSNGWDYANNPMYESGVDLPSNFDPNYPLDMGGPSDAKSAPGGMVDDIDSNTHNGFRNKGFQNNNYLLGEGFLIGIVTEMIFVLILVSLLYCVYKSSQSNKMQYIHGISYDENSKV